MTRLTSKGIYTVKIGNHPCTILLPKSEIMRRGGYQRRTLEVHLELRDQQLKNNLVCVCMCICTYIYRERQRERERLLYQNFRITANQKSAIDTHINKKKQLKYNTKDSHQTTRGENKRRREEKGATKMKPTQLIIWQ